MFQIVYEHEHEHVLDAVTSERARRAEQATTVAVHVAVAVNDHVDAHVACAVSMPHRGEPDFAR